MVDSWKVKGRITYKSEKRYYSNANGQGSVFSIEIIDLNKGEIRGTFFKEECEKWYPLL